MIQSSAGISGTLLPERYVVARLIDDANALGVPLFPAKLTRQLGTWWRRVEGAVGPATSIREVFDRVAMPLCAMFGFTAHDACFDGRACRVRLATRRRTPVALLVTPWSDRPSSRWAELADYARSIGAPWAIALSPPHLSIVPVRGYAVRRSIDIELPVALSTEAGVRLLAIVQADAFDAPARDGPPVPPIAGIVHLAEQFQDDVRSDLQHGVETSLRALCPVIAAPRRAAPATTGGQPGRLTAFDEALTIVYRVLFLLFVESRRLVPDDAPIYREAYSVSQFCRTAARGDATGLWDALAAATRLSRMGCSTTTMRMAPFNGALFAKASAPALEARSRPRRAHHTRERDDAVRTTLVALGSRAGRAGREVINYRDLGVEQLGAVYERVLDLEHVPATGRSTGKPGAAHDSRSARHHSQLRKQTGTFYTPQPLADFIVRRTLAPLVEDMPSHAVLAVRVVDPAMGSGAFLVAACRFLARAYEAALLAEGHLAVSDVDDEARAEMRRRVAERCLWGVDRNPTAVHLARLSLWLTCLARGKPLNFLDHRLRTGDSLIGAWPSDLPRLSMRASRAPAALPLFDAHGFDDVVLAAIRPLRSLNARRDDTVADVRAREADWRRFQAPSSPLQRWRLAAHLWCARWFAGTTDRPDEAETRALLDAVTRGDPTLDAGRVSRRAATAATLASERAFFHWPLEFPDVFYDDEGRELADGGFDAVIGNPPWEMVRRDEAGGGVAGDLVAYVRQSAQYPSCGTGHLNLYQAFVDRTFRLTRRGGRVGLVLPWSLATDDGAARLRARLLSDAALDVVIGLDNTKGMFPIHRGLRFMAVTATTGRATERVRTCVGLRSGDDLDDLPTRGVTSAFADAVTPEQLRAISGPAIRFPDTRRPGEMALLLSLSRRFRPLGAEDGWRVSFGRELNATEIRPHLAARGVPVVEGKQLSPFVVDTTGARQIAASVVSTLIDTRRTMRPRLGYRDISGVGNRHTLIAAVIPAGVVTTHTVFCLKQQLDTHRQHFLCALLNSCVLNVVVRMLMGGHVTTTLAEALPAPGWRGDDVDATIAQLARRLSTGHCARDDETELQALVARRFELTRDELQLVLDGVPRLGVPERTAVLGSFDRHRFERGEA